MLSIDIYIFSS